MTALTQRLAGDRTAQIILGLSALFGLAYLFHDFGLAAPYPVNVVIKAAGIIRSPSLPGSKSIPSWPWASSWDLWAISSWPWNRPSWPPGSVPSVWAIWSISTSSPASASTRVVAAAGAGSRRWPWPRMAW